MYCKYCGHEIDDGSHFCKICGKEVNPTGDRKAIVLIVIAVIALLAIIAVAVVLIPQMNLYIYSRNNDNTAMQDTPAESATPTFSPTAITSTAPTPYVTANEPICSRLETMPWGKSRIYVESHMNEKVSRRANNGTAIEYTNIDFCGMPGSLMLEFGSKDSLFYVGYSSDDPGMFGYYCGYLETKLGKATRSNKDTCLWVNTALGIDIYLHEEIDNNAGIFTYLYIGVTGADYWFLHEL